MILTLIAFLFALVFFLPGLILGFWFCARVLRKAGFSIWWSVSLFFRRRWWC